MVTCGTPRTPRLAHKTEVFMKSHLTPRSIAAAFNMYNVYRLDFSERALKWGTGPLTSPLGVRGDTSVRPPGKPRGFGWVGASAEFYTR